MLTIDRSASTTMKYWSKTNVRPKTILRTSSVGRSGRWFANGRGVTILSDMVYRPWSLETKRIETVSTDIDIPSAGSWHRLAQGSEFFRQQRRCWSIIFKQSFAAPDGAAQLRK